MTEFSGYMEEIHECVICLGRFSDETLLLNHVCPAAPGNEFIELGGNTLPLDQRNYQSPPSPHPERYEETVPGAGSAQNDRLGLISPENAGGEAALAIGEDAFRAGWYAATHQLANQCYNVDEAWSNYDPPEDIKALA